MWSFDGGCAGVVEIILCDLGLVDGYRDRGDCWLGVSGRVDDVHKQRHTLVGLRAGAMSDWADSGKSGRQRRHSIAGRWR